MPKTPNVKVLKRWMSLDWELANHDPLGCVVRCFAGRWMVDVKTIRRDLDGFRAFGQTIKIGYHSETGKRFYFYAEGVTPLFTRSETMKDYPAFLRSDLWCDERYRAIEKAQQEESLRWLKEHTSRPTLRPSG